MNTIILPVMRVTRDLAIQLLSIYIESTAQNDTQPIAAHILATYAPKASEEIPNIQSYKDYMRLQSAVHQELQPWLRGLIEAIFDTAVAELTIWGRTTANPYRLEEYMEQSYPHWNRDPADRMVREFYDYVIDPLVMMAGGWWKPQIEIYPYHLWHLNWHGYDAIIQPGEDFRVVEWTRNNNAYGQAGHPTVTRVDSETVAGEESFDAINQYIQQRIPEERANVIKAVLMGKGSTVARPIGSGSLKVSRRPTIPPTGDSLRQFKESVESYQEAYQSDSQPLPSHTPADTFYALQVAATTPRVKAAPVAKKPKPIRKY